MPNPPLLFPRTSSVSPQVHFRVTWSLDVKSPEWEIADVRRDRKVSKILPSNYTIICLLVDFQHLQCFHAEFSRQSLPLTWSYMLAQNIGNLFLMGRLPCQVQSLKNPASTSLRPKNLVTGHLECLIGAVSRRQSWREHYRLVYCSC